MTEIEQKIYKRFLEKKSRFDKEILHLGNCQGDYIDFPFAFGSSICYVRYNKKTSKPITIKYPVSSFIPSDKDNYLFLDII